MTTRKQLLEVEGERRDDEDKDGVEVTVTVKAPKAAPKAAPKPGQVEESKTKRELLLG